MYHSTPLMRYASLADCLVSEFDYELVQLVHQFDRSLVYIEAEFSLKSPPNCHFGVFTLYLDLSIEIR